MNGWMDGGTCLSRQEDSPHSSDEKPEAQRREAACPRSQKPHVASPPWLAPSAQFPRHGEGVRGENVILWAAGPQLPFWPLTKAWRTCT